MAQPRKVPEAAQDEEAEVEDVFDVTKLPFTILHQQEALQNAQQDISNEIQSSIQAAKNEFFVKQADTLTQMASMREEFFKRFIELEAEYANKLAAVKQELRAVQRDTNQRPKIDDVKKLVQTEVSALKHNELKKMKEEILNTVLRRIDGRLQEISILGEKIERLELYRSSSENRIETLERKGGRQVGSVGDGQEEALSQFRVDFAMMLDTVKEDILRQRDLDQSQLQEYKNTQHRLYEDVLKELQAIQQRVEMLEDNVSKEIEKFGESKLAVSNSLEKHERTITEFLSSAKADIRTLSGQCTWNEERIIINSQELRETKSTLEDVTTRLRRLITMDALLHLEKNFKKKVDTIDGKMESLAVELANQLELEVETFSFLCREEEEDEENIAERKMERIRVLRDILQENEEDSDAGTEPDAFTGEVTTTGQANPAPPRTAPLSRTSRGLWKTAIGGVQRKIQTLFRYKQTAEAFLGTAEKIKREKDKIKKTLNKREPIPGPLPALISNESTPTAREVPPSENEARPTSAHLRDDIMAALSESAARARLTAAEKRKVVIAQMIEARITETEQALRQEIDSKANVSSVQLIEDNLSSLEEFAREIDERKIERNTVDNAMETLKKNDLKIIHEGLETVLDRQNKHQGMISAVKQKLEQKAEASFLRELASSATQLQASVTDLVSEVASTELGLCKLSARYDELVEGLSALLAIQGALPALEESTQHTKQSPRKMDAVQEKLSLVRNYFGCLSCDQKLLVKKEKGKFVINLPQNDTRLRGELESATFTLRRNEGVTLSPRKTATLRSPEKAAAIAQRRNKEIGGENERSLSEGAAVPGQVHVPAIHDEFSLLSDNDKYSARIVGEDSWRQAVVPGSSSFLRQVSEKTTEIVDGFELDRIRCRSISSNRSLAQSRGCASLKA